MPHSYFYNDSLYFCTAMVPRRGNGGDTSDRFTTVSKKCSIDTSNVAVPARSAARTPVEEAVNRAKAHSSKSPTCVVGNRSGNRCRASATATVLASTTRDAVKDALREWSSEEAARHNETTLRLHEQQKDKPLRGMSTLAMAREEIHTTGDSSLKVKRNPHTKNSKKSMNPKRKSTHCHKARMLLRRQEHIESELAHEGWMDFTLKHIVSLDKDVFTKVVGTIFETIRDKINTQKTLFEIVMGIDADTIMRYFLATSCCVVATIFAYQGISLGSWVSLIISGLSATVAAYAMSKEIFSGALGVLREALSKRFAPHTDLTPGEEQAVVDDYMRDDFDDCISMQEFESEHEAAAVHEEEIGDVEAIYERMWNQENFLKHESGEWLVRSGLCLLGEVLQAIMVGGVGFAVLNRKGKLVDDLSKIPRIASGISGLIEIVLKWISTIMDDFLGTDIKSYFSQNKELDKWAQEVMILADQNDAGKLELSPTSSNRVRKLMQTGRQLVVDKLVTSGLGSQMHRSCMRELDKLQLTHNRVGLGSETKPEPIGVMMRGESGVGKSFITQRLMKFVGIRVMPRGQRENFHADFHSEVWSCNNEEEHANGYKGQFFTVLDDLGQQVPAPGAKTEAMAIIRMINANPTRLNMAALHEKGNVTFTSEMIFASTNRRTFWDMNIVQPEAFLRRWACIVEVAPKKEWCTEGTADKPLQERRLDHSRLGEGFNPDVPEFHLLKIQDVKQQTYTTEKVMDFQEFEDYLVNLYKSRRAAHKKVLASIQDQASARLLRVQEEEEAEELLKHESGLMGGLTRSRRGWLGWIKGVLDSVGLTKEDETAAERAETLWRSLRERSRRLLNEKKKQVHELYLKCMAKDKTGRTTLIAVLAITAIALVVLGRPIARVVSKWFGGWKSPFRDRSRDWEIGAKQIHDLEELVQIISEDQECFLTKMGLPVNRTDAGLNRLRKFLVKKAATALDRRAWYEESHRGKLAKYYYELDPNHEAGLFAEPAAYSEFAQGYMSSVFRRNVYHMYNEGASVEDTASAGKVTMVKGTLMLINKHYILEMQAAQRNGYSTDKNLRFVPHGRPTKEVRIPMSHFLNPANVSGMEGTEDAVLVNCAPFIHVHTDIISKFVRNDDFDRLRDHEFTVYAPPGPRGMKQHDVLGHHADVVKVSGQTHKGMFWYQAPTNAGDCGSLLFDNASGNPQRRLVGIHAAGESHTNKSSSRLAFAQRVSQEMLEEMAKKWDMPLTARPESGDMGWDEEDPRGLDVVARDTKRNIIMTRNNLVPTYMHGALGEPTRIPAIAEPFVNSDGVLVKPLEVALAGEHANNTPVDVDDVAAVVWSLTRALLPFMKNRGKLLDSETAITGIVGTALKAINRKSGGGHYALHNPKIAPGKTGAFGKEGEFNLKSTESKKLIAYAEGVFEKMKQGVIHDAPFRLFLKQEKRARKKVEAGKARLVKAESVENVVNIRRVYGMTVADLMEKHTLSGIAVGINPLGKQWDFLASLLSKKGGKVIAGDFAGFDQSQSGQLLRATMAVMKNLAGHNDPDINMVEMCIEETLAAPRCIIDDKIYQNDHGLPSGNPLTSIMNSLFVHIAFRLCWLGLMRAEGETRRACLARYDDEVTLVAYGDDHLVNVSDDVIGEFNQNTLSTAMAKLGLTYTSDDKEDKNPPDYRSLEGVTFLKRAFRWEDRISAYVAPLDLPTLLEVCYYADVTNAPNAVTRTNVERTFFELALHGEEVYGKWSRKLEVEHNKRSPHHVVRPDFLTALEGAQGLIPGMHRGFEVEDVKQA